ncbi:unnamed protein product [Cuscuta epithymum]|uniref:MATH domain-containing protein n=1 Tax=Cuscuta epithymum TaxID=186058 RepID=A0AAV0DM33_9ASTE|nr:unnamed protein product [Cuscuta epithymum]
MKTEYGFDKLFPLSTFNDPSNGYLVNDTCAFGAEILSLSSATKHECYSLVKAPIKNGTYTWTIKSFLTLKKRETYTRSNEFIVEGSKWKLLVYPSGDSRANGQYLSLFLELLDVEGLIAHGRKIYAKFILRICNHLVILKHKEIEGLTLELVLACQINTPYCFPLTMIYLIIYFAMFLNRAVAKFFGDEAGSWGHPKFMKLSVLESSSNGFLVKDSLIVEVEFKLISKYS